jgi:hypothetical protein
MKTTEFNGHIITWDDLKSLLLGQDLEERTKHYICYGIDEEFNCYEGTAEFCCDELIDITDINITD